MENGTEEKITLTRAELNNLVKSSVQEALEHISNAAADQKSAGKRMTKAEIMKISNRKERQAAIRENMDEFVK